MSQDLQSAFGTLRMAEQYRRAGSWAKANEDEFSFPPYNLVGLSIELSLKAFLLTAGMAASELRSQSYGHKLERLMERAKEWQLLDRVKLLESHQQAIRLLAPAYQQHDLRYHKTGMMRLPDWTYIAMAACILTYGLHDHVLGQLIGAEKAAVRLALRGRFNDGPNASPACPPPKDEFTLVRYRSSDDA